MTCISNDGSDIIHKKIDVKFLSQNTDDIENYEIASTVEWIKIHHFKRVGLQFPDELLPLAIPISLKLKGFVDCNFGIMADTSYGSCCVDEVGAEHYSVEAIVHYGDACLTPTHRKVPVKYVFGQRKIDDKQLKLATETVRSHFENQTLNNICVTLICDLRYLSFGEKLSEELKEIQNLCLHKSIPNYPENEIMDFKLENFQSLGSHLIETECENRYEGKSVLYIGDNFDYSMKTLLISVRHNFYNQPMLVFYPQSNRIERIEPEIDRWIKSRLFSVSVARKAKRVGLLIATLSCERYLEVYNRLYGLMRANGKLVYSIVVGKINANKLANFADLDCLVVIGCPRGCMQLCEHRGEFYRPIVTPFEMECALARESINILADRYLFDFKELLDMAENCSAAVGCDGNESDNSAEDNRSQLVSRIDSDWSVAAVDRSTRSWFGLDPRMGQTPIAMVTEGRSGIASGYNDEIDYK